MSKSALIIGGGIVGLSTAYYLNKLGWHVTVVERGKIDATGTSHGNAGLIVPSHFVSIASRGMMRAGMKMAFNPRAAFGMKFGSAGLPNWVARSARFALSDHAERVAPYIRDLNLLSQREYEKLLPSIGMPNHPNKRGIFIVAESQKCVEELGHFASTAAELGLEAHVLNADELSNRAKIKVESYGGLYFSCDWDVPPHLVMSHLYEYLQSAGVDFAMDCEITGFRVSNGKIWAAIAGDREFVADEYIFTAGSWTGKLAHMLGLDLPMLPGKGHSMTITGLPEIPSAPILLEEGKVAINPMVDGLRISGNLILGDWSSAPSKHRVKAVQQRLQRVFPAWRSYNFAAEKIWVGFRPCTPDGLPYVGRHGAWSNLTLAAGHAMMGLSLGPATGLLVSQILTHEKPEMPVAALSPERKI